MKIGLLPKSKRFVAALADEVALHAEAKSILAANKQCNLAETISKADTDLATCLLYHSLLQSRHAPFIRQINQLPAKPFNGNKRIKFLIIPSMFYLEHPEMGGDGLLAQAIVQRNGFDCETIPINSRGSVAENKKIILREIRKQKHANIWLLSISKGTADLRACLQDIAVDAFPSNLKGWVNFSGIFCGSILADLRVNHAAKRLFLRAVCRLARVDYRLIGELSTKHAYWRQPMPFLDKLAMIHIIGFPLRCHVQPMLAHRFTALSQLGPTDGMIRLMDTIHYPGHVYPLWGCDHFARHQHVSGLLYRLCHYIFSSTRDGH